MTRARGACVRRYASWQSLWTLPAIFLVVFVVAIPVLILVVEAVTAASIGKTLTLPSVLDAFRFSAWQALLSTGLTLAIGCVISWILARYEFTGRAFVKTILTIPFVLPTVVVAAAFLALLPTSMERGLTAILLAHVFFNISVVIRLVTPAWSIIDTNLLFAARTLGASSARVALRIVLPIARSSISSAGALVFLMSFTSYGVVRILGRPGSSTVEVEIYRRAVLFGDVSGATVLALVQTLLILTVFAVTTRRSTSELPRIETTRRVAPIGAIVIAFGLTALVLAPLITLVVRSVYVDDHWTLSGWRTVFTGSGPLFSNVDVPSTIARSILFALAAAAISVPVGLAAAIGLARRQGKWTKVALVAPMATSAVVIGFGIVVAYDTDPYDFRSQWWLLPVVHAVVALPFVVRSALPIAEAIPQGLREAASTLGASPARRWTRIDVPLMAPALATSFGLSAALSLGEFGATSFLTRRNSETLPILVDQLLGRAGESAFTASMVVATTLLLLTAVVVVAFDSTLRSRGGT